VADFSEAADECTVSGTRAKRLARVPDLVVGREERLALGEVEVALGVGERRRGCRPQKVTARGRPRGAVVTRYKVCRDRDERYDTRQYLGEVHVDGVAGVADERFPSGVQRRAVFEHTG